MANKTAWPYPPVDRETAARRLTNRWHEQCHAFPTMRDDVPLAVYVRANLKTVMRGGLLQAYENESSRLPAAK